jgi:crotonobetainyl-CoA:carnitine CoA-transferase CaiB-like acyl-CoA transferase
VAADSRPLVIHLSGHQAAWESLLKAADRMDLLEDPRFATRSDRTERHWEIVKILQETFARRPRDYWLPRLDANNIANAPINTISEVFQDPQIKHIGIPKRIHHPKMGATNLVGSPINLSDTPAQFFRPAPLLGEHTEEILGRLGYDGATLRELRASGVI